MKKGETSGISRETDLPVVITLTGTNFGTSSNDNLKVNIYPVNEDRKLPFVAEGSRILSHSHTQIKFQLPPGYGKGCTITVTVAGRESDPATDKFDYNSPIVTNVSETSLFSIFFF